MASRTFSIGFGILITLTDVEGGVRVDISGSAKDITAVFFDLNPIGGSDNNALINTYNVIGNEVTSFDFEQNKVSSINGVNLNPAGNFDAGIAIADTGSTFIGTTSFVILGTGLNIEDFSNQRFGVRLSGNQGSSKVVGTVPTLDVTPPNAPTIVNVTDNVGSITGPIANNGFTNDTTPTFTIGLAGTGAVVGDRVKLLNGSAQIATYVLQAADITAGNVTITPNALAQGQYSITATITDSSGNISVASAPRSFTLDTLGPTVTISDNVSGIANLATGSITYTYTFNESITGLAANDFTVTNGTITSVTGTGKTWTVKVAPTPNVASGTISLVLANGAVIDAAGNPNVAVTNNTQTIDTLAPTVQISLAYLDGNNTLTPGETATVTFTFSEVPVGFTVSDITAENGTISHLTATANPLVYTATLTPAPNVSDPTNVIRVSSGYTDTAGNSGVIGTSPNYKVDTALFGPLTFSSLGYVSQSTFPTSTAFNPVTNPIVIQPSGAPGAEPDYFILPEKGQSFIQSIVLTTGERQTAPNTVVKVSTTNSPLVAPDYVWNDLDNDNVLDLVELSSKRSFNGAAELNYTFETSIAANSTVYLKVFSNIVDDGTLTTDKQLRFRLQDQVDSDENGNSTTGEFDFGAATGTLTLYLNGTPSTLKPQSADSQSAPQLENGFRKEQFSPIAHFDPFAPSTLAVDVNADGSVEKTQSAELVRAAGTLVEGTGGESFGAAHFMALPKLEFDVDQRATSSGGTIRSNPTENVEFQVVWNAAPTINTINFYNNFGTSAFSNTNTTLNDSFLELIDANLFGEIYAIDEFTKDGKVYRGELTGDKQLPSGTVKIEQEATTGKISDSDSTLKVVNYVPPPNFQTFIDTLAQNYPLIPPETAYQINISNPNLVLSTYNPTSNPLISVIQLQSTATTQINIQPTGNNRSVIDFRQTTITNMNGISIGATIIGSTVGDTIIGSTGDDIINAGNGADVLDGWIGDDILMGGNGADRFVFGVNYGSDTIQGVNSAGNPIAGLDSNDIIDLRQLKIQNSRSLDTNGNGRFDRGDTPYSGFATTTGSGSTSTLTLDFTTFSNAQLPNTVTTTKITFFGVPDVSTSQFLFA